MRLLITGGGTGGHLYPGIAVAEALRRRTECELLFVGTKHGLEARVVPEKGFPLRTVWISGMHRGRLWKNVLFPVKMAVSLFQSMGIVAAYHPDVVLGTGGYASWPVLTAARLLRMKTALQEQNLAPGLVTRLLAGGAERVYLSFEDSRSFFRKSSNLKVCGNPTRDDLERGTREEGLERFGLEASRRTLFVFGGSQGARGINEAMLDIAEDLFKEERFQILWATGPRWIESIEERLPDAKHVRLLPYIREMGSAYAVSDLVLCRAGATTVAELTRLGKPAVFIPLPSAAAGHQEANARALRDAGAAEMVLESDLSDGRLRELLVKLLHDEGRLKSMREESRRLGRPRAASEIAEDILRIREA